MVEEGARRRVVVEVCNARNLMPKDGQGTASAYAVVDFDGQRRRTATRPRDLNPQWGERLEFLVHDPDAMCAETLELNLYNDKKAIAATGGGGRRGGTFLGKEEKEKAPAAAAAAASAAEEKKPEAPAEEKKAEEAKKEEKKPAEADKKEEKDDKKKSPEKRKKDGEKPKEEGKAKDETKKEVAPVPPSPSKAPPPSPSKMELAAAGVAGDLEIRPQSAAERSMAASAGNASYDLVDRVPYLFVRLLKAKHHGGGDKQPLYAQLSIGTHAVKTRAATAAGEWDQVFAFHKDSLTATSLEVTVHEEAKKPAAEGEATPPDTNLGYVSFDLHEVPKRSPPDSALAPQWYTLEGHANDGTAACDVMLAVWVGTQVDEAFQEAWQSDSGGYLVHTRSKAYLSPKLWYLRLSVIQAQDLRLPAPPDAKAKPMGPAFPELYVKAQLGAQVFKTCRVALGSAATGTSNPSWNEDLLFVAAEPFDPFLTVVVEDIFSGQPVGQARVPLSTVHRRSDDRVEPPSRWLNLCGDEARPYAGRVHVRVCLEGGYHVLDEAANVASDVRAASKQLSKPPVGMLEVGIRGAANLVPMKIAKDGASGSTDAYVVLKYGPKWARTRTILDQFNPRWNEQYAWDVFDPCTVLTIAVFDNVRYRSADASGDAGKLPKDARIGKLRIRLSTLDTNRVYANTFALTAVHPVGVRKMGELELAIRFTCPSWLTLMQAYGSPLLPRMHYVKPLGPAQQDVLRQTAMRIVSEPPLGPEVVQYLLDTDTHSWSMRRSKANWFRVVGCLSHVATAVRWANRVRTWTHPTTTVLVHALLVAVVLCPEMILPTVCLYLFLVLLWRYRARPREPTGMDPRLSHVDSTLLGDVAAQGERIEALLSWRDPRATAVFAVVCLLAALVMYAVPFKLLLLAMGFYYLRHPRFRGDMPSAGFNFFRRLPSNSDRVL
uniref:C2 domain-containing protein n=1 Tax=Oryza barthii TaxID=65489 RepID=A0A0D3FLW6_9ORYZ